MKNCFVLCILLTAFTATQAQDHTGPTHHFAIALGSDYLFPFDNQLDNVAKPAGFNGSVTYTLQQDKIGIQLSPFAKLHSGEDFNAMKQYYKDDGQTLTSYNGGTYISTGMDMGLQFILIDHGKLPVFKTFVQYGLSSVRVPEVSYSSESEASGGIDVRADPGLGLGSNLQFGIICDAFQSNNTIYNVKLGFMSESANITIPTSTHFDALNETIRTNDIFEWRAFSLYLNLSVSFDL